MTRESPRNPFYQHDVMKICREKKREEVLIKTN